MTLRRPPPADRAPEPCPEDDHARGARTSPPILSDTFDTRVLVDLGRRKGRIVVEFATVEDLERIVSIMAPGHRPEPTVVAETVVGG